MEQILDRRKMDQDKQYLVIFKEWGSKYNTWLSDTKL